MTSFKKKTTSRGKPILPNGTKASLNNNQLLVSTGIPSLDNIIGGGLAVGTLLLVEEDLHGSYSNVIQKIFLGEGIACEQNLVLATCEKEPHQHLLEIPCTTDEIRQSNLRKSSNNDADLQIAWRYQNKAKVDTPVSRTSFGHYFDLSHHIDKEKLERVNYTCFCPKMSAKGAKAVNERYRVLLKDIKSKIDKDCLYTANSTTIPPILRISLCSLGSPSWKERLLDTFEYDHSLAWFLLSLRSLLRASFSTCMVSIPTHLFENEAYVSRIRHCCDTVIRLESFPDFQLNPLFKEYHGFLYVEKLSSLNCINGQNIDTTDLAFKLKRKQFVIEKFHLPPDISETASRAQNNQQSTKIKSGTPLCSSKPGSNLLDF